MNQGLQISIAIVVSGSAAAGEVISAKQIVTQGGIPIITQGGDTIVVQA